MQQGRGGMGMHKHGVSGYAPRSPRYKFMQTLEDNRNRIKKPRAKLTHDNVRDLFNKLARRV